MTYAILNNSTKAVDKIKLKLHQISNYCSNAEGGRNPSLEWKTNDEVIAKEKKIVNIASNSMLAGRISVKIPNTVVSFNHLMIICVEYVVTIEAISTYFKKSTIELKFNIIIGSVPIIPRSQNPIAKLSNIPRTLDKLAVAGDVVVLEEVEQPQTDDGPKPEVDLIQFWNTQ